MDIHRLASLVPPVSKVSIQTMPGNILHPVIELHAQLCTYNIDPRYIAIKLCLSCQGKISLKLQLPPEPIKLLMGFTVHTDTQCICCRS